MDSYIDHVHDDISSQPKRIFSSGKISKQKKLVRKKRLGLNELEKKIAEFTNCEVLNYISESVNLHKNYKSVLFTTPEGSYVEDLDFDKLQFVVNFKSITDLKHKNEHFKTVNSLLPDGGLYIGRFYSNNTRKLHIYGKFGKRVGRFIWGLDFVINRVLPKMKIISKLYSLVSKRPNYSISRAECLGRIAYCGFEIMDFRVINGNHYFTAVKVKEPSDNPNPTYYPFVRLQRIGKNGNIIKVYKFRTMHPYSEYLQDYVVAQNGYNEVGKPKNDWRVTRWGKFMRKYWLDEAPQIINVLLGNMKLVGVRPLSKARFKELPEDMQQKRINYKPGCFPPYVALNMPDEFGNIEAERIYLQDVEKDPRFTDLKYMWKAVSNIVSNKIRSA